MTKKLSPDIKDMIDAVLKRKLYCFRLEHEGQSEEYRNGIEYARSMLEETTTEGQLRTAYLEITNARHKEFVDDSLSGKIYELVEYHVNTKDSDLGLKDLGGLLYESDFVEGFSRSIEDAYDIYLMHRNMKRFFINNALG